MVGWEKVTGALSTALCELPNTWPPVHYARVCQPIQLCNSMHHIYYTINQDYVGLPPLCTAIVEVQGCVYLNTWHQWKGREEGNRFFFAVVGKRESTHYLAQVTADSSHCFLTPPTTHLWPQSGWQFQQVWWSEGTPSLLSHSQPRRWCNWEHLLSIVTNQWSDKGENGIHH